MEQSSGYHRGVAMPGLDDIAVFVRVVHAGGFTKAARELGMPKSTVSRKVSELEARLGARLLQRTTRSLSLTDVGRTYFERGARIVAQAEEAEHEVRAFDETPRGLLRVTAPLEFRYLGDALARFLVAHPEVRCELLCTDRVVDLIEEGFDLAIRAGPLRDSTLIARTLGHGVMHLVAAPAYLERHGRPRRPADLARHAGLVFGGGAARPWKLERQRNRVEVTPRVRLRANNFDALHLAALAGLGVAVLPGFFAGADIEKGRLERVLPGWSPPSVPLSIVYPSTRHLSATVRAFIEALATGAIAGMGALR